MDNFWSQAGNRRKDRVKNNDVRKIFGMKKLFERHIHGLMLFKIVWPCRMHGR